MLNRFQKIYMQTFVKPYLTWYLKKERISKVCGLELAVKPTVFHPKYFFSSIFLFDFINTLNLKKKLFLEIGCGSGFISLLAYKKNAIVTCCDVNGLAIDCTKQNFVKNFSRNFEKFSVIQSDLFDRIPVLNFDMIVINPPYFFENINSDNQLAWNCGKNGEYFIKLFSQMKDFMHYHTEIYMVLADNCEIDRIKAIADAQHFSFELVEQKKIKWEVNFIFKIKSI
jgi:release factor glutamine methyltransferase